MDNSNTLNKFGHFCAIFRIDSVISMQNLIAKEVLSSLFDFVLMCKIFRFENNIKFSVFGGGEKIGICGKINK
jgi:hypothetical protein